MLILLDNTKGTATQNSQSLNIVHLSICCHYFCFIQIANSLGTIQTDTGAGSCKNAIV